MKLLPIICLLIPTLALAEPKKGVTLDNESLTTMLDNMGLNPKEGNKYVDVMIRESDLDYPVRLSLSPNGRVLWIQVNVAELPEQPPVEPLLNLLRKNANLTGKAQFCIRGKFLLLSQPVDNHDLTPAMLKKELQDICSVAKALERDLNTKEWK